MKYHIIGAESSKLWNETVRSFKDCTVYYLCGYAKAFQLHGDGEPLLFYFDNGNTRAINVVMKKDISKDKYFIGKIKENKYFELSTPYGYGGFIIEGSDYISVSHEYIKWCKENNIINEFVRFNLFSDHIFQYIGDVSTMAKNVVCGLSPEWDDIWFDFAHKVRKNYNKAVKSGLELRVFDGKRDMTEFLSIYYSTMKRNNAREKYYFNKNFFSVLNRMEDNIIYFDAVIDDVTVSTELVLYDNFAAYSFLGGTYAEYFDLRPNDFLKVEIIKWAKQKDLHKFVLGGGYSSNDGIFEYKKAFAPNSLYDFYIGKTVFDEKVYDNLINIRKKDATFNIKTDYFPVYKG
jgi:hypothetical protein